jgi:hypothetical protein
MIEKGPKSANPTLCGPPGGHIAPNEPIKMIQKGPKSANPPSAGRPVTIGVRDWGNRASASATWDQIEGPLTLPREETCSRRRATAPPTLMATIRGHAYSFLSLGPSRRYIKWGSW